MLEYAGDKDSVNHTLTYAEEQLEYAKEQENKKRQTVSINYEGEYKKLKEINNKNLEAMKDFDRCLGESQAENKKLKETLRTKNMQIEFLECAAEKTKEKLENYELLKRMIKVLIEGL